MQLGFDIVQDGAQINSFSFCAAEPDGGRDVTSFIGDVSVDADDADEQCLA